MKKKIIILSVVFVIIGILLVVYPKLEFQTEDKFIAFRYTDDISEFETQLSFSESYMYYADRDISISGIDTKKFLCFYVIIMEYIEGNYCEREFILEEEYIKTFLERAEIRDSSSDLDIAQLIEGKEAIVGNTRYIANEDAEWIDYVLDGRYESMFIYYVEDLLVIQVGMPDEGPRFIAYK